MMKSQYFDDFDAFANSVSGVDCTMMFQNPKRRIWSITHVNLPEVHVQLGQLGSGNIVEGQSSSNGYLLYMPLTYTCEYLVKGKVLDKNSLMILEPGCDFCLSSNDEHPWCSIFVPTHKIARGGELVGRASGSEKMTCRVTRPNPQLAEQFRGFAGRLATAVANGWQIESGPAATFAEAEALIISSLVVGQPQASQPNQPGRPRLPRQEIIRRAQDLLEEWEGEPILVGDWAAAVGVSERTFRTAFKEFFGMAPLGYLQLRQIHQVRRALRSAEPEAVSVSDVLLRNGVWELGRFASRYRRVVGELPSETLGGNKFLM